MGDDIVNGSSRKEQIEAMLANDPNDAMLHYMLAMEYVSAGNDAEAVRRFSELQRVAPDYVPGYLQAGQAFLRLGQLDQARSTWQCGIEVAARLGDRHAHDEMLGFLATLDE
jgi:Flp pilus assembly protein TadD